MEILLVAPYALFAVLATAHAFNTLRRPDWQRVKVPVGDGLPLSSTAPPRRLDLSRPDSPRHRATDRLLRIP